MKQTLLVGMALAAMTIHSSNADAARDNGVEAPDREFYGFFMSNQLWSDGESRYGDYGFSRQKIGFPDDNYMILPFGNNVGLYAATAIDGIYYGIPYQYSASLQAPTPLPMFRYNIYTGHFENIGDWCAGNDTSLKINDMTYDSRNKRLLAIGYSMLEGSVIYEVNPETAELKRIRSCSATEENGGFSNKIPAGVIACDGVGRVFVISQSGNLYQVDMESDTRMIKLAELPYQQLMLNQSFEQDKSNPSKFYWTANTYLNPHEYVDDNGVKHTEGDHGTHTWLVEITMPNIGNGEYSSDDTFEWIERGEVGTNAQFLGLHIPYANGGVDAPGHATDCTFTNAEDGSTCTLRFKAPTRTLSGKELAPGSLRVFDVYREGELISPKKGVDGIEPGRECVFVDENPPANGEYRYDIVCVDQDWKEGIKTPIFAFIGQDKPKSVENINISVSDNFLNVSLTWDAPTQGDKGGLFNPENTVYDVMRLPDNVEVAKGLTEPKFDDTLRRLLRYSYRITARNEFGSNVSYSDEFVAGKPVTDFPFDESFDSSTVMLHKWTPVDNNNDGQTFIFGTDLTHAIFGDYEPGATYIVTPTSIDQGVGDADEWLISPPIQFGDDNYGIELEIRSLTPEHFTLYTGARNRVEGMEQFADVRLQEPQISASNQVMFNKYRFMLPESVRNTVACVAIRLDTPLPNDMASISQIGNIWIDTAGEIFSGINSVESENVTVSFDNNSIRISGTGTGQLFNMAGVNVRTVGEGLTDISDLASGVYILTINGKSYKIAK